MRLIAAWLLLAVFVTVLFAGWIAPFRYDEQRRDEALLSPRSGHLLGTDELGRDRFSRLLYGARVSLLLAPAAAALSTFLAAVIGMAAGWGKPPGPRGTPSSRLSRPGGRPRIRGSAPEPGGRILLLITDLFLGLPWLFRLLAGRE